jgi:hypothetical protein
LNNRPNPRFAKTENFRDEYDSNENNSQSPMNAKMEEKGEAHSSVVSYMRKLTAVSHEVDENRCKIMKSTEMR